MENILPERVTLLACDLKVPNGVWRLVPWGIVLPLLDKSLPRIARYRTQGFKSAAL